ncbi:MAG: hypothetical protein M3P06_23705 [Acidobacteriota bacterium]|nr:hypothetical protein [Acidobacteriota bacterium]
MQHRLARDRRHDLLDAGQHLAIAIEDELLCNRRPSAVCADDESRAQLLLASATEERHALRIAAQKARGRNPSHAAVCALLEQLQVEPGHPSDAELVALRAQRDRAPGR